MKKFLGISLIAVFLVLGSTVFAEGLLMDQVSVTVKHIEEEDDQKWLYFSSYSKSEVFRMRLFGKLYFPKLDDKYEDTTRDGLGDLYSGVRAHLKFPGLSQGFQSTVGYKWNQDYQIYMAGAGYDWKINKSLSMGLWYDAANRLALSSANDANNYQRQKQEFSLNYNPKPWGYSLLLTRSDYSYPDADTTSVYNLKKKRMLNEDYSILSYTLNQRLTWKTTSKLNLEFGYRNWTSDYYNDQEGTDLTTGQPTGKRDGEGTKAILGATYLQSKHWTWNTECSQSTSEGYNGTADIGYLGVEGKYSSNGNWRLISKLRLYDLEYSQDFTDAYENPKDKDADYSSRRQQVFALEFEQKLKYLTYGMQPFVKNYDYVSEQEQDQTTTGLIGTLEWQWLNLNWYLLAAHEGTLVTRKGTYMLRAQYKF